MNQGELPSIYFKPGPANGQADESMSAEMAARRATWTLAAPVINPFDDLVPENGQAAALIQADLINQFIPDSNDMFNGFRDAQEVNLDIEEVSHFRNI